MKTVPEITENEELREALANAIEIGVMEVLDSGGLLSNLDWFTYKVTEAFRVPDHLLKMRD